MEFTLTLAGPPWRGVYSSVFFYALSDAHNEKILKLVLYSQKCELLNLYVIFQNKTLLGS